MTTSRANQGCFCFFCRISLYLIGSPEAVDPGQPHLYLLDMSQEGKSYSDTTAREPGPVARCSSCPNSDCDFTAVACVVRTNFLSSGRPEPKMSGKNTKFGPPGAMSLSGPSFRVLRGYAGVLLEPGLGGQENVTARGVTRAFYGRRKDGATWCDVASSLKPSKLCHSIATMRIKYTVDPRPYKRLFIQRFPSSS